MFHSGSDFVRFLLVERGDRGAVCTYYYGLAPDTLGRCANASDADGSEQMALAAEGIRKQLPLLAGDARVLARDPLVSGVAADPDPTSTGMAAQHLLDMSAEQPGYNRICVADGKRRQTVAVRRSGLRPAARAVTTPSMPAWILPSLQRQRHSVPREAQISDIRLDTLDWRHRAPLPGRCS